MRPKTLVLGLNAALLLSTAVIAADPAAPAPLVIEEEQPLFTLSIEGGVTAFNIPDTDTVGITNIGGGNANQPLFEGLDDTLYGGTISLGMSAPLNADGLSVNVSGFGSFASRSGSESVTLSDERLLVISAPSLPSGTINLDTYDVDGVAIGTSVGDDGAATAIASGGASDTGGSASLGTIFPAADSAVTSGADGFTHAGISTDGQTLAFGVVATDEGAIFVGYGELLGWGVTTDVKQDMVYAGGDITLSQRSADEGGVAFTAYGGPSFRYLGTETTTNTTVTPSQSAYNYDYATFGLNTVENIDTYYAGAVVGASVDIDVWQGSTLSLGLGAGAYYASSSYGSETEATLFGGTEGFDESATSRLDLDPEAGFAYTLKGDAKFSADIAENMQINFGLGTEYLSRVATSRVVGSNGVTNNDVNGDDNDAAVDVEYNGANATGGTVLAFGDAWSYKATVGLTGQF
ncbi:MAG: hypothetical protein EOP24_23165 [Hyphomicrobiales bacterium]|nr:MAG: hypothetical protein EOP24_23165 [Hyphomicrobiales bacterium]